MTDINAVQKMKKNSDFLICIDSDGCVFDTMEIKHKECFIPNIINYWSLQSISKYAREACEYVNLYSKKRGINRFPALIEALDLLACRSECIRRGFRLPDISSLREWVAKEKKLGNPALEKYAENHPEDETIALTLRWSTAVNETISDMVHGVPPFPYVRECLEKMKEKADIIVVSQTPVEALEREWAEHDIGKYVSVIAGQEMGTKAQCISYAMEHGYSCENVLMIGDAPGDYSAVVQNKCLFYPINPGGEEHSWENLLLEGLEFLFSGTYAGKYEKKLIDEFDATLPSSPPWTIK